MLCADHLQQMIIRICCLRSASSKIVSRICCRPGRCSSRILRRNGGGVDRYVRYIASSHMRNNICCRRCPGSKRSHHLLQADSSQHRQSSCVLRAKSLQQFFWFCCPQTRGSTANRRICCPRTASSRSLRCCAAGRPPAAKWKACAAGRLRAAIVHAKDRLPLETDTTSSV